VTGNVTTPWVNGAATASNLKYTEVGQITLGAALTSGSYLGSGLNATGTSGTVGAFVPAYFDTTVTHGCAAGNFTYSAQPFKVDVTARNAAGGTTVNYSNLGSCAVCSKDVTLSAWDSATGLAANPGPGALTPAQPPALVLATAFGATSAGVGSSSNGIYTFTSATTAPTAIRLRAVDSAGVTSDVLTATYPAHVEGSTTVRSGRLKLSNAFGSEKLLLAMPMQTQYYDSDGYWHTNTNDSCTSLSAPTITTTIPTVTAGPAAPYLAASGLFTLSLTASAAGYADMTFASPAWLMFDWTGSGTASYPKARAGFGVYNQLGNSKRIIYRREVR
jgi:MSHA biogenesis protein MshQ